MTKKELKIKISMGLHARAATSFIQISNKFKSLIWVEKDNRRINGKSLLGVLSLNIEKNDSFSILANGADEEKAVKLLSTFIESGCDEKKIANMLNYMK